MVKKTRNSTKTPEKSISERVNHYKGQNRTLRKRIENLEARLFDLETRMNKYKHLLPKEAECINSKDKKNIEEDSRIDFNKRFNPKFKEKK